MALPAKAFEHTVQIVDGHMCELGGVGHMPLVLRPRTTYVVGQPTTTVSPARPTVIGNLALVELDGCTFVFIEHRGVWDEIQRRPLLDDEAEKLHRFDAPRVVTIRVLAVPEPLAQEARGIPIFLVLDEKLGKPILAIGNSIITGRLRPGPRTQARIGFEWHPEGYEPTWLSSVL